jgi:hypothetical protein
VAADEINSDELTQLLRVAAGMIMEDASAEAARASVLPD